MNYLKRFFQVDFGPMVEVYPRLYLGSLEDSLNERLLRDHNITYLLSIHDVSDEVPLTARNRHYFRIKAADDLSQDLTPTFSRAIQFINRAHKMNANVLVHCRAGVSRSATLCAAYIADKEGVHPEYAIEHIKRSRPIVNPNKSFRAQLDHWYKSSHVA
jgi:protein-tyrosine phosphatase